MQAVDSHNLGPLENGGFRDRVIPSLCETPPDWPVP